MVEVKMKPLIKGVGSFLLSNLRSTHQNSGSISANHCYNLFMRHANGLAPHLRGVMPQTMVEIGPGSSLGVGFTALLCGVAKYFALDLQEHRSTDHDREVLKSICDLIQKESDFSEVNDSGDILFPAPPSREIWKIFENHVMESRLLDMTQKIDEDLASRSGQYIKYIAPWTDKAVLAPDSVDWIMTHSVLEHVDDLDETYRAMSRWLKSGGYTTHLIDFSSHLLTKNWNGHWSIDPTTWTLLRGRRPYLINRFWRSHHIAAMQRCGFEVLSESTYRREDGLSRNALRHPYSTMPVGDEFIAMSFIVARKVRYLA